MVRSAALEQRRADGLFQRDGDATVGRITVGAWSPFLGCGIGYVRFERPGAWPGKTLSVDSARALACQPLQLSERTSSTGMVICMPGVRRRSKVCGL